MRLKWHCYYCKRPHFHPSRENRPDELKPVRNAQRSFCAEECVERFHAIANRKEKVYA